MSLHTARVIPEERFSCPPAAVHFAGVEKEIDMEIKQIPLRLEGLTKSARAASAWVEQSDLSPSDQVLRIKVTGSFDTPYTLDAIASFLLFSDSEWFEIHDGFDGKQSEFISRKSIASLFLQLADVVPGWIGKFCVSVRFCATDHAVPF